MKTEFYELVGLLNSSVVLDINIVNAINKLEQKIIEVEKRIECARRSNQDSNSIIMSLVGSFQDKGKTEEELTYGDFETLQRGVYDVDIALNFNDQEPIENNWYGLFEEPKQEELSNGGIPYKVCYHCAIKEEETVMTQVNGNWLCCDCYDEIKDDIEENIAPTYQCKNMHTFDKVKEVIQILKTLDNGECVDGETMDYIVKELGMEEYLLRSLIMKNEYNVTKDLMREKFELEF